MKGKYSKRKPVSALVTVLVLTAAVLAVTVGAMAVSVIRREREEPEPTTVETAIQETVTLPRETPEPASPPTVTETQEQTVPATTEETTVPETEPTVPQTTEESENQSSGAGNAVVPGTTAGTDNGANPATSEDTGSLPNTNSTACKNHMQMALPYNSPELAASCTNYGRKYLWCPTCGEQWLVTDNAKPPLGHNEATSIVSPRYGAEGYTEHYCYRCGLVLYRDNYVPALTDSVIPQPAEPPASQPPATEAIQAENSAAES